MLVRSANLRRLAAEEFDVLVIGGGINGAVAAAALAGNGVRAGLVEKEDFASGVSSQSSNLAWGGIKYMESFEMRLVRKLCKSRNRLTELFPSSVREIRFLTVIGKDFRWPAPLVYLGSLLYWMLGSFHTRPPRYLRKSTIKKLEPNLDVSEISAGLEYSDCHFKDNDARFVFNMVHTADSSGAAIANYLSVVDSRRIDGLWLTDVRDEITGETFAIRSKVLINACGAYTDEVNRRSRQLTKHRHLFSKGVHLIVDRLFSHQRVLTMFASDGRMFFLIPMGARTCVGTTDTEVSDPSVGVTDEDRKFILDNVNANLTIDPPLRMDDVVAERCGVRPLAVRSEHNPGPESSDTEESGDWLQLSRKHALDIDEERAHISIFGGKLTDCLNVGDALIRQVARLGVHISEPVGSWCGEPPGSERLRFMRAAEAYELDNAIPSANRIKGESVSERLWRRYGTAAFGLLNRIEHDAGQKAPVLTCSSILRCEVEYARDSEMVVTLDDFLRRRTRLAQLVRREELMTDPGMKLLKELLFACSSNTAVKRGNNMHGDTRDCSNLL